MSMKPYEGALQALSDVPFGYTLSLIGGKWRLVILYFLVEYETIRFNELKRKIGAITYKTLSEQLKGMERDGLRPPGISPNPAEGRIQPVGQSALPLPDYGSHVPLGRGPSARRCRT
ncbi:helix-turn-helix domain-containing protein [Megasphaera sp. An286]|uniref:winged helix-turn-helix transcriptional regulator n=1 Tax=Megasphaera sp. An286 TaxID=1965622 RepID=UPI002100A1EA|nr:helix-turn-helix domain-containing protein [Megasphaera sp. An286]